MPYVQEPTPANSNTGALERIQVSRDGYIRLQPTTFRHISLVHLISGLDEEPEPGPLTGGAQQSAIVGYTEWVSLESPVITIGWDWQLSARHGSSVCTRLAEVRSNVMLLDMEGCDLGPLRSSEILGETVDGREWSEEVLRAISDRY